MSRRTVWGDNMVRPICKNVFLLRQKAEPAAPADVAVGRDLMDTLNFHDAHCVGMAANMIGVSKCIIAVSLGPVKLLMYNPKIEAKRGPYDAEEGCLSLTGTRKTVRYEEIEVTFRDALWQPQRRTFRGQTAQIIQHEVDHTEGILI